MREVNREAARQGLTVSYARTAAARWLAGTQPRPPAGQLVVAVLSRALRRGVDAADAGLANAPGAATLLARAGGGGGDLPQSRGAVLTGLVRLCRTDADAETQPHLYAQPYPAVQALPARWLSPLAAPEPEPAPAPAPASPSALAAETDATVSASDWLQEVVLEWAERHGGARARTPLLAHLAEELVSLTCRPGTPPAALLSQASRMVFLLAGMSADAGHHALADAYWRHAAEAGRVAGDRGAYALALRAMSTQARRLDQSRRALLLADAAVESYAQAPPAVRSYLLVERAACHAARGQAHRARADLSAAEECHPGDDRRSGDRQTGGRQTGDRRPGDRHNGDRHSAGPFTTYPVCALDYQRAAVFELLGERETAVRAAHASLAARPDSQCRSRALTQARLARVLLRTGQLEEACAQACAFFELLPDLASAQVSGEVVRLRAALSPYRRARTARTVWELARSAV
ncbi:hypothetical protein ACWGJ2_36560 [Streptomyces sp. NPDC054796]